MEHIGESVVDKADDESRTMPRITSSNCQGRGGYWVCQTWQRVGDGAESDYSGLPPVGRGLPAAVLQSGRCQPGSRQAQADGAGPAAAADAEAGTGGGRREAEPSTRDPGEFYHDLLLLLDDLLRRGQSSRSIDLEILEGAAPDGDRHE